MTLVGEDGKKCRIVKIGHSELFWTTSVLKDWKKCRMTKFANADEFTTEHAQEHKIRSSD